MKPREPGTYCDKCGTFREAFALCSGKSGVAGLRPRPFFSAKSQPVLAKVGYNLFLLHEVVLLLTGTVGGGGAVGSGAEQERAAGAAALCWQLWLTVPLLLSGVLLSEPCGSVVCLHLRSVLGLV